MSTIPHITYLFFYQVMLQFDESIINMESNMANENYVSGLRDLANTRHIPNGVKRVIEDCADIIESLSGECDLLEPKVEDLFDHTDENKNIKSEEMVCCGEYIAGSRCSACPDRCDIHEVPPIITSDETSSQFTYININQSKLTAAIVESIYGYMDTMGIPRSEFDPNFVVKMVSSMAVSFFKYGYVADAYPDKFSAISDVRTRMSNYRETGNKHFLVDAANFTMIESMHPSSRYNAHWGVNDSENSPGRNAVSSRNLVNEDNDGNRLTG